MTNLIHYKELILASTTTKTASSTTVSTASPTSATTPTITATATATTTATIRKTEHQNDEQPKPENKASRTDINDEETQDPEGEHNFNPSFFYKNYFLMYFIKNYIK